MAKSTFPIPNVSRPQPPRTKDKSGKFTVEYRAYVEDLRVCYNLVHIASAVLDRPLTLHFGDERQGIVRAMTNGKDIYIPKRHPRRRLVTKHELAHIYFKSLIRLRLLFVKELIRKMEREAGKSFAPPIRERLIDDLCFFINILDDLRVNSLWGLLYPGDGVDMVDWYEGEVGPRMLMKAQQDFPEGDVTNLFTFAKLVCLHQDPTSTKWGRFRDEFIQCRDEVHFKSFKAMLLIAGNTILRVARAIAEDLQEQEESPTKGEDKKSQEDPQVLEDPDAEQDPDDVGGKFSGNDDIDRIVQDKLDSKAVDDLVKVFTYIESELRPQPHFADDDAGFDYRQKPPPDPMEDLEDAQEARQLVRMDEDSAEAAVEEGEEEAINNARAIQAAMNDLVASGGFAQSHEGYLTKDVKAEINFVKVHRKDVVPTVLPPEDLDVAKHWQKYFQAVMGALALRTEEDGSELLTDIYITQKVNNDPFECYARETSGRGFRLNILIDMSWSMTPIFHHVSRLTAVLQRALDFPFVHINVFGFNSTSKGVVNIYQFPSHVTGLLSAKGGPNGVTPLSHAIQVAGRDMVHCRDDSHLFVISDGLPVYQMRGRTGYVDQDTLINWTHDAVSNLRAQHVQTWCFMMGPGGPSKKLEQNMDRMFGGKAWRYISPEELFTDAFTFIREHFLRYLRSR